MFNLDYITKEDVTEHNWKWLEILYHSYGILLIGGSRSRKTNPLLNIINHKPDIDKIHLSAKDPYEAKYQLFNWKTRKYELKVFKWFLSIYRILKWYWWYL